MRYLKRMWFLLWYRLFWFALRRVQVVLGNPSWGSCANCRWTSFDIGDKLEVKVVYRYKQEPDGYARDELLEMLREVRKHEAVQGWKVPE